MISSKFCSSSFSLSSRYRIISHPCIENEIYSIDIFFFPKVKHKTIRMFEKSYESPWEFETNRVMCCFSESFECKLQSSEMLNEGISFCGDSAIYFDIYSWFFLLVSIAVHLNPSRISCTLRKILPD